MEMRVGISGTRRFNDYVLFSKYMDSFREHIDIALLISGGAKGIDELAYNYAVKNGITFVCYPPVPSEGFPRTFFRRNLRIVEACDILIAFPDKKSKGTRHAINLAKKLNKEYYVIEL